MFHGNRIQKRNENENGIDHDDWTEPEVPAGAPFIKWEMLFWFLFGVEGFGGGAESAAGPGGGNMLFIVAGLYLPDRINVN